MDVVDSSVFSLRRAQSLRRDDPVGIRVEEQEEDHAQSHEVHVDQQENAAVVEAPAPLHAAYRVDGASEGDEDGQDEKGIGVDDGKAGDQQREAKTEENQQNSTKEGSPARVEKAG